MTPRTWIATLLEDLEDTKHILDILELRYPQGSPKLEDIDVEDIEDMLGILEILKVKEKEKLVFLS